MNYAQRWTMAQALRRPLPNPRETGAEAAPVASPPVFVPVETTEPAQKGSFPVGTLVVGVLVGMTITAFLAMSGVMDGK